MRKNLVLARVGRNSLHRSWIDASKPRDWDLRLCPFQEIAPQDDLDCIQGEVIPGPKWTGLRQLLNSWDGWRNYEQIWLPDDDILASQDAIGAMFDAARRLDFKLFAPGLHEASHFAHFIAMRNHRFFARRVGFVEIMVPGFSRATLEQLLPTLDLTTTGWGWGLDSLWPKLLDYRDLGIIDGAPVLHTRAVGQFRDAELGRRVLEESDRILAGNACGQRMVTFAGIGPDLQEMRLDPDALLVALVEGWQYLFRQEPRILHWIVAAQEPLSEWPSYPVAGTPVSPR
ncbi:hypothetical protein GCM10011504_55450 [Siccirubricoccus deserti]|uniref:DUF707 domain-containing protein n=1 Tax=Siccirubricoccus deserti TaxID=2013562 RepID=A0A9X0R3A0_9PROT|nr:hypothetical protein [Siccirubricoccus deserti]MBC4019056.1 hypothetical protein [Siccirubricoccus deserti]GGC70584.1 hypothetical protein GCM10011504_55450 [Siccirubricoccus deserti]